MPFDGLTLGFVARELNEKLLGGRVDRVVQPEKDTVILTLRAGNENHRLLLCASPNNARCHLSQISFPNPLEPPTFCMLLRKQLLGGRLTGVNQVGGDRVLHVDFDTISELGDHVNRRLVLEMMGRHSNLMLLNEQGRILDAARHVNETMSRVRQILPGLPYEAPPAQDKLDPASATAEELRARLTACQAAPAAKALQGSVSGLSPATAREISLRLTNGRTEATAADVNCDQLAAFLRRLPELASPRVLVDDRGDPADALPFLFVSYPADRQQPAADISRALERFFGSRDIEDRLHQKSVSMVRLLKSHIERCEKKLALQEEALTAAAKMETYRRAGDAINANLFLLQKGMKQAELPDYYDENGGTITVQLDDTLSPAQNAQKYFKKYQKARSAREIAAEQKEKTLSELNLLEGALLDVDKCETESDLDEIRQSLVEAGYMKRITNRREKRALPESSVLRFVSSDGIEIHVGKNAAQNEKLTAAARPNETWLHAKDMPGSHVIIRTEGDVPPTTLKEAALLAAWYSKGQHGSHVPIDYTLRRYVKKPGGSPTGFVIYTHQRTAYMTASEADIRAIRSVKP